MHTPMLSDEWNPSFTSVTKIDLLHWKGPDKFCVVLHNILSIEECQHLIELSERRGYQKALRNGDVGQKNLDRCMYDDSKLTEQVWQRILKATAEKDRAAQNSLVHVPWINERHQKRNTGKVFSAVGLNERVCFERHDPGAFQAPHCDSPCVRNMEAGVERYGEQSFISFQLFLNDDFEGGATRFVPQEHGDCDCGESAENDTLEDGVGGIILHASKRARTKPKSVDVAPRTGSVVMYQHDCLHQNAVVRSGRQYLLRSDLMYTSQGPGMEYSRMPIMARQLDDLY